MVWTDLWNATLQWVSLHPEAAYLLIWLVSFCESLALVGLLVPGTVIMIGVGALAGVGAISVPVTLLTAMIGAVAGDGISYWLGRHYHLELKQRWPFRSYPRILARGEAFFQRHGGKSVLLGRFVGPVRPVIPAIAGMLDMPPLRFFWINVLSAVGWAVVYILPGMLLAGSLTLIGAISSRLSLLFLLLGLLLWFTFWLCRKAYILLGKLGPEKERLLFPLLSLTLFLAAWAFSGVLENLLPGDPLVQADQAVYRLLRALRTSWGDQLLVAVTELGGWLVNVGIAATVLLVLLFRRQFRTAGFWLLAAAGGTGLVQLFKWLLHRPRPIEIYQGISSWGFPSGHATMSVVLYGFLAIILVRGFSPGCRWFPFGFAIGISLLIAFSRLYLGAHWLSDVLGGLSLGWAWVTLLGIFYLRRPGSPPPKGLLLGAVLLAMVLTGTWNIQSQHARDLARYQIQNPIRELRDENWREQAWKELPGRRIDLGGEVEGPLNLQWAGDPEYLSALLIKQGWTITAGLNLRQLLNILVPHATIRQLPLVPLLENGRQERLRLSLNQGEQRLVLRLWPTEFRLSDRNQPLWVGSVDSEFAYSMGSLLTLPRGTGNYSPALQKLLTALPPEAIVRSVKRTLQKVPTTPGWNGQTLLLAERQPIKQGN